MKNLIRLFLVAAIASAIGFSACSTGDDSVKGDGSADYADDGGNGDAAGLEVGAEAQGETSDGATD